MRDAIYFPVKVNMQINQKINFDSLQWISMRRLLFGLTKKLTLWCSLRWLHACHPYLPFYLTFLFNDHPENLNSLQGKLSQLALSANEVLCKAHQNSPRLWDLKAHIFPVSSKSVRPSLVKSASFVQDRTIFNAGLTDAEGDALPW